MRGLLFLFCALMALQALGFLRLGNGYEGRLASILIQTLESVVAAVCAWNACRRARGNARAKSPNLRTLGRAAGGIDPNGAGHLLRL